MHFSKEMVPEVYFEDHPEFTELYYVAWESAFKHIKEIQGLPVPRHIDEGFDPTRLWIWDTCFMVHFCKYAPDIFPGIQSLDNFYVPMYDDVSTVCSIHHPDNPPLFAWVEYEYYKFTGDASRIRRNLVDKQYLQKHYEFIENAKIGIRVPGTFMLNTIQKNEIGYLWSDIASGMDNTPRGGGHSSSIYWLDALAQQALSALCISRMAKAIDENVIAKEYVEKYEEKCNLLNQYYFDEADGSYYDINATSHDINPVLTPASFWPLLAEAANDERAKCQIKTILDPNLLGGDIPLPSVSRSNPSFSPDGRYWQGGVWLPTTYMAIKALERYEYYDLAADIAERTVTHMCNVYKNYEPHTIWEAYSPSETSPASGKMQNSTTRPDFCGWSALGPISLLIENIIGIYKVDAVSRTIYCHPNKIGNHSIKNLQFGNIKCDISVTDTNLKVCTKTPFILVIDNYQHQCIAGITEIKIE